MQSGAGRDVRLSPDPAAGEGDRGGQEGRPGAGRFLCIPAVGADRHLHRPRFRLRAAPGHLPLPHHDPAPAGQAEGDARQVPLVPRKVLARVQVNCRDFF